MKIRVRSHLTLRKVAGDRASLDIETDQLTIRELLEELSERFGEDFRRMIFDPETQSGTRHIPILINGRHYRNLPKKLDTELKEGDEVSLFPLMAGGL